MTDAAHKSAGALSLNDAGVFLSCEQHQHRRSFNSVFARNRRRHRSTLRVRKSDHVQIAHRPQRVGRTRTGCAARRKSLARILFMARGWPSRNTHRRVSVCGHNDPSEGLPAIAISFPSIRASRSRKVFLIGIRRSRSTSDACESRMKIIGTSIALHQRHSLTSRKLSNSGSRASVV